MDGSNTHNHGHLYDRSEEIEVGGNDPLGKLATWIQPESTVLELGPATGYFSKYLKEELSCVVDAVEISPTMAEKAAQYCRDIWVADLDQEDLVERFQVKSYDYVIAADVIEHLRNPEEVIRKSKALLKDDGKLLLSIPNVGHAAVIAGLLQGDFHYTEEGLLDRTHVHFYTRRSLVAFLETCGLYVTASSDVVFLPEETEFSDDLSGIEESVRNILLNRPDGLVYQFVLSASANSDDQLEEAALLTEANQEIDALRQKRREKFQEELHVVKQALRDAEKLAFERENDKQVLREEISQLRTGLANAEELVKELHEEQVNLRGGLKHAKELAIEWEATNQKLRRELEQVRSGLKHAEKLAIERMEKLNQIKSTKTWRLMQKLKITGK